MGAPTHFIKYHGLGNDFIVFRGGMAGLPSPSTEEVVRLCRRGTGVGADGVILARPSEVAALRMELTNSDGTVPEMCGNGIRCLVKFAVEELGLRQDPLPVETPAGVLACAWRADDAGRVLSVRVAMGRPTFDRAAIPMEGGGSALEVEVPVEGRVFRGTGVGTGNPHLVLFGDSAEATARAWGPRLTGHPLFPRGTNVEFAEVLSAEHLRVTVWERGCGLTRACGTGATATAAAAVALGHAVADAPIRVTLPGGDLAITVAGDGSQAWMEGPAVEVYRGTLSAP